MSSIKKNFLYNVLYQILVLIVPLITTPYVSRIIGAEGIGIYAYTHSIVYYFILFAMLGINNYGNRTIAKVREDKEKLANSFISIYSLQVIMSIIMLVIYTVYSIFFVKEYQWMYFIQGIYMCSVFFDINWFYFGIEKFKLTVIGNIIIKIVSTILVFVFIRTRLDLWKYAVIMTVTILITQIYLWVYLRKNIKLTKESIKANCKTAIKHLKPCLILFIPVIAVSLYKIMDKIMLGQLSNMTEVGLYDNAEKIVNMPLGLISALGVVMLPRMSNIVSSGNSEKMKEYISKSIEFIMFMAFPISFGIMAVGTEFAPLFFGEEFLGAGKLINALSITSIFISWANVLRTQLLIPMEKDNIYIYSVISGAIVNLVFNFILIPKMNALGAVIGTILAEFTVMIVQTLALRKELPIMQYLSKSYGFGVKAFFMYILLCIFEKIYANRFGGWGQIILEVAIGFMIYSILNFKYIKRNLKL